MKKILMFLLLPLGLGGGLTAGYTMKPAADYEGEHGETKVAGGAGDEKSVSEEPHVTASSEGHAPGAPSETAHSLEGDPDLVDYVKLDRQFVVPLIANGKVSAMVVISMAVEAEPGATDLIFAHEPKLRDGFLKVLFTHAQSGGFDGVFTSDKALSDLRTALNATARSVIGSKVRQVLLTSVVRQDL